MLQLYSLSILFTQHTLIISLCLLAIGTKKKELVLSFWFIQQVMAQRPMTENLGLRDCLVIIAQGICKRIAMKWSRTLRKEELLKLMKKGSIKASWNFKAIEEHLTGSPWKTVPLENLRSQHQKGQGSSFREFTLMLSYGNKWKQASLKWPRSHTYCFGSSFEKSSKQLKIPTKAEVLKLGCHSSPAQ